MADAALKDFFEDESTARADGDRFVVDIEGFEGPLDLLLTLARNQRVDLARISILALAEQYLAYVEAIRRTRLELAADYLVMAAWLAYLKSRLLLPDPPADDEPSAEELAGDLAQRLRRLEAMRRLAQHLGERDRLGRDVFPRGAPEGLQTATTPRYEASLFDLLTAYAAQRQRQTPSAIVIARRQIWALADARAILERLIGRIVEWTPIEEILRHYLVPEQRATVMASAFTASLELAREGRIELRQSAPFRPLMLRMMNETDAKSWTEAGDYE